MPSITWPWLGNCSELESGPGLRSLTLHTLFTGGAFPITSILTPAVFCYREGRDQTVVFDAPGKRTGWCKRKRWHLWFCCIAFELNHLQHYRNAVLTGTLLISLSITKINDKTLSFRMTRISLFWSDAPSFVSAFQNHITTIWKILFYDLTIPIV